MPSLARRVLRATAAAGLVAAAAFYSSREAARALRADLLQQTRIVAMAIPPEWAAELTGTAADLDSQGYLRIKEQLTAIRTANPDIRFVSLMGLNARGQALVLVDNEPPDSEDYSPPGDPYPEASDIMLAAFEEGLETTTPPEQDRWGTWISAFAPLPGVQFNRRPILVSLDIDAADWNRHVAAHAALPVASAVIAVLLAAGFLVLQQSRRTLHARQRELQQSEKRFADLAEQSRTVAWETDADGLYTFLSPAAEPIFGYPPEDLVGHKHFYDLHPPEGREAFKQKAFEVFRQQAEFIGFENPVQTRDGRIIWVATHGLPVLDRDGSLRGYRGNDADITERRLAREALQASEAQKKAILDNIPLHVLLLDMELRIEWANRAAAESVGKRAEDTVGTPCHAFWGDPAAPCKNCPAVAALRSGKPCHSRVTTPDGRTWDERAAPVFDADGRIAGVVEISEDITEHSATEAQVRELLDESTRARQALLGILEDEKAIEEELKRQTQAQQLLIHISSAFINRPLDTVHAALQDALKSLAEFTGSDRAYVFDYDVEHQICRNTHEWCAEGIEPQIDRLQAVPLSIMPDWLEAHRAGKPLSIPEVQALPPGPVRETLESQSIQSLITVPLMEGGACTGFLGFDSVRAPHAYSRQELNLLAIFVELLVNVRLRQQSEQTRHDLEVQLMQSQKMDSIGRLAGGVAHDFNNRLTLILGHVGMVLDQADLAPTHRTRLEEIRRTAADSADLTRQLLAFARQQPIAPQVIDLNETVGGAVQMLQRLIGENIELRWSPAADLWPVQADPAQIHQILTNVCVNARDAIDGTGHVDIETANAAFDDDAPPHPDREAGDYVRLSIRDSGRGMASHEREHLFEPFFTTKGSNERAGLGLPMVYGIVKQNNGYIDASSSPGHGTLFHIYLPRHAGKRPPPPRPVPAPKTHNGRPTILLVEDEPAILAMAAEILDGVGYAVRSALSPVEAIQLAKEYSGPIHLLLSDVVLPGMNGRDLAQTLRALHPGLRVLFMSGYAADILTRNGVVDDHVHFIPKPFSKEELTAKVRQALAD
jgi:PAS domain S-box-containing protein